MNKTIFEQMNGIYTIQGDYYPSDLTLPAEEERPIGVWAQRCLRYLKQHHKILYYNLLTSDKLHSHLADVEEEAQILFLRLVKEYAEREGVTEQLKAENSMEWVRRINNIIIGNRQVGSNKQSYHEIFKIIRVGIQKIYAHLFYK